MKKPHFAIVSFRVGGRRVCSSCGREHPQLMRIDGRVTRTKQCLDCGEPLPRKLTYPPRARKRWAVRERDPHTGEFTDHRCESKEQAEEELRRLERDWTPDPLKLRLMEHLSATIRRLKADTWEDGVDELIEQLGGDPRRRRVKAITWADAIEKIVQELREKGRAESYLYDMRRIVTDFGAITGTTGPAHVTLESIGEYRSKRMAGGWQRGERTVVGVGGRAINRDLATLSAFFKRAVKRSWMLKNPLLGEADERVKVDEVRHEYMPDADLRAILAAASPDWMRALILLTYYTGARLSDILGTTWEDVDLEGSREVEHGPPGPKVWIRGEKTSTPRWSPIPPACVTALRELRNRPQVDRLLFPVRESASGRSWTSRRFGEICIEARLTRTRPDGTPTNRWKLTDVRRKFNTDLGHLGATPKERLLLMGHKTVQVNQRHYEGIEAQRLVGLVAGLPAFGVA